MGLFSDDDNDKGFFRQAAELVFGVALMVGAMNLMSSVADSISNAFGDNPATAAGQGAEISGADYGELSPKDTPNAAKGVEGPKRG